MALNTELQELVDNDKIGFADVFELYAVMCVNHTRDMMNTVIDDEGIDATMANIGSLSVSNLTSEAVNTGRSMVPEMLGDDIPLGYEKGVTESWINFVIRCTIEMHVSESNSFQVKVV